MGAAAKPAADPGFDKAVHIYTQKKGGVGKSTIAGWTAEYLKGKYPHVACYDTDPSNQTFSRMAALEVESINVLRDDDIDPELFDPLVGKILKAPGPVVIDTGASTFHSLWNYIVKTRLFPFLSRRGRRIVLHVPIAPKPDLADTLDGFEQICAYAPRRSVIVWINERETPLVMDGEKFFDLDVARRNEDKMLKVIVNSEQKYALPRKTVGRMLEKSQTFGEAIEEDRTCGTGDGWLGDRLSQVQTEIFDQLEEAGI